MGCSSNKEPKEYLNTVEAILKTYNEAIKEKDFEVICFNLDERSGIIIFLLYVTYLNKASKYYEFVNSCKNSDTPNIDSLEGIYPKNMF